MAVQTEVIQNSYVAAGGATEFVYTFPIHDESWIVVTKNGTTLTLDTDYTVGGVGEDAGGTVTLLAGATLNDEIVLSLDIPFTQTIEYPYNDRFPAEAHEKAIDKLTLMCLLLDSRISPLIEKGTEPVGAGEWEVDITFAVEAESDDYQVFISPHWNTPYWVSNKTTAGFQVNFATVPSSSSFFDWRADA